MTKTSRSLPAFRPDWRGGGIALAAAGLVLTLNACGGGADETAPGAPAPTEAVTSNTEFREGASPAAILEPGTTNRPAEINLLSATVSDGGLDPEPLAGRVGESYVLRITGDGASHTLIIADLVTETEIAADGETEVDFTISGDAGDRAITLDGEPAGTFRVTKAGGISQ